MLITFAILAYFGVRNFSAGGARDAFSNADRLLSLQERLRIDWEDEIQGAVIDDGALVDLSNWVYIWGHWPVVLTTAVVLYVLRREKYALLRNAIFVSGAIGFVFFAFFPVAPPRYLDLGLVDTVTERSHAYRALQPPGLTNQYAAFPSLHAGWNLLVGIVLFLAFTSLAARAFAVVMPVAMALAVIATANHFVIDVVAGVVVVLIGLAAAFVIERMSAKPTPSTLSGDGVSGDGRATRPAERATARGSPPRG